jgi:hypothetical protein
MPTQLRAVAPLQELRLRSHEIVAELFSAMLAQIIGGTEHKQPRRTVACQ